MFTPVGPDAESTAGLLLCGISFFDQLPHAGADGRPIAGTCTALSSSGRQRLAEMAALALTECARGIENREAALFLCVPAWAVGEAGMDVLDGVIDRTPIPIDRTRSRVFVGDAPVVAQALQAAEAELGRGRFPWCYVGGVDTLVEPDVLADLESQGRLRIEPGDPGIVPGEGAAFIRVSEHKKDSMAVLAGMATATEHQRLSSGCMPDGRVLGGAIRVALGAASAVPNQVGLLVHGSLGEPFFAHEHAAAIIESGLEGEMEPWTASLALGETGAAAGALSIAYVSFLVGKRGLNPAPPATSEAPHQGALIVLTSQGADRAALFVRGIS